MVIFLGKISRMSDHLGIIVWFFVSSMMKRILIHCCFHSLLIRYYYLYYMLINKYIIFIYSYDYNNYITCESIFKILIDFISFYLFIFFWFYFRNDFRYISRKTNFFKKCYSFWDVKFYNIYEYNGNVKSIWYVIKYKGKN